MSHTGIFQITDLTYKAGEQGDLARALHVTEQRACGTSMRWNTLPVEPCCHAVAVVSARPSATRAFLAALPTSAIRAAERRAVRTA